MKCYIILDGSCFKVTGRILYIDYPISMTKPRSPTCLYLSRVFGTFGEAICIHYTEVKWVSRCLKSPAMLLLSVKQLFPDEQKRTHQSIIGLLLWDPPATGGFPTARSSNGECVSMACSVFHEIHKLCIFALCVFVAFTSHCIIFNTSCDFYHPWTAKVLFSYLLVCSLVR